MEDVDVYFDDLTITHTGINVLQSTAYHQYDAVAGRWLDPEREFYSPYLSMGNNPIKWLDPDGGCISCLGYSFFEDTQKLFDFFTLASKGVLPEAATAHLYTASQLYNIPPELREFFSEYGFSHKDVRSFFDEMNGLVIKGVADKTREFSFADLEVNFLDGSGLKFINRVSGDAFVKGTTRANVDPLKGAGAKIYELSGGKPMKDYVVRIVGHTHNIEVKGNRFAGRPSYNDKKLHKNYSAIASFVLNTRNGTLYYIGKGQVRWRKLKNAILFFE